MKLCVYIGTVLMAVLMGCVSSPTSPRPSSVGDGKSYRTLEGIDSLMWQQPDSALKMMMEFAASPEADSLNEFEAHYCQVLIAELLFKNDYAQSNREEVLKAVGYFDSIVDLHGADARGASLPFLNARGHYIKGVGYYEQDSLIEACTEYLCALRTMENHFAENELVGTKANFMALTYNRLVELFSAQYMQEPAIYCGRQSLSYDKIAQTSPDRIANTYFFIGQQYNKLEEEDSAAYYYKMALETNPDSKTSLYRDAVSMLALCEYNVHHDTLASLDSLKRMMVQASNEMERLNRFLLIGSIYRDMGQYDSAKVYLEPVVEKHVKGAKVAAILLRNIALTEGDTLKANQYALFLAEEGATTANNQARVSTLNDMFQTYLQEKQEAASLRERRKAVRATLTVVLPLVVVLAAVMVILMRRRSKKLMAAQAAEAQRQLNEASQQHDEEQRELQTKVEQATQHTREILQQRVADIYQSNNKNRLQRILEAVDDTYPQIVARLKSEHPELNETERHILLLSFLHFRIKEEADLLGLSENTVGKYRSNLGKTLGKDPISDWV